MRQNRLFRRVSIALTACLVATVPVVGAGAKSSGKSARAAAAAGRAISVKNGRTSMIHSYKDAVKETIYIESDIEDDERPGVDGGGNPINDLIATDIIRPKGSGNNFQVSTIYEMSPYYQACFGDGGACPLKLGRGNEHEVKEEEDGDAVPEKFPLYYDNYFVPRGYAVIHQDAPGTRNSEGCMVLGGNGELAAAKATMSWLRGGENAAKAYRLDPNTGLPTEEVKANWSNGKAGMIGKSYDATIANSAASMGLKGLKTIVPVGGIDRWYNYMFNNGVQYTGNAATAGLFVYYIDQPPPDDEEFTLKWTTHQGTESAVCEAKGSAISAEAGNASGDYTAFWDERDYVRDPNELPSNVEYASNADRVKASVFIANGINDWNVKPNNGFEWWQALKRAGVPVKMWQSQTGHVDPFDYRREKWVNTLHRWFDRWLYGINNGIMAQPRFDVERGPDKWKSYRTWPSPRAKKLRLWLGPKTKKRIGTLSKKRPGKDATQSYSDSYPSESAMVSNRKQEKEERLLFTTRKLRRNVRMSGEFPIKLTAEVDKPDTNFTYLLVDYGKDLRVNHEDGGEGIATSTTKQDCFGQKTAKDNGCYFRTSKTTVSNPIEIVTRGWLDAKHRPRKGVEAERPYKHLRESEPLTPGERYAFKWKGFGEDYVFKKGHRIGVVVAGSDSTFTIADPSQANVTVGLHDSRVMLPVVGKKARRAVKRAAR